MCLTSNEKNIILSKVNLGNLKPLNFENENDLKVMISYALDIVDLEIKNIKEKYDTENTISRKMELHNQLLTVLSEKEIIENLYITYLMNPTSLYKKNAI